MLKGTAAAAVTYKPTIDAVEYEDALTLANNVWYNFTIKATDINEEGKTETLYVKIENIDGTLVWEKTVENFSFANTGTLRGICWNSPRGNSRLNLDNVLVTKEIQAGTCDTPTYTITGVNGTARKFTLACGTEGASIYYSASELAADASGWTEYTGETTTEAETIYIMAKKGTAFSEVTSFATGAGTTVSLNAPVIAVTNLVSEGEKYTCTFGASSNQTNVQFSPTATLSATFTDLSDNTEEVTLPYTPTAEGTLTVTASSNGYASSNSAIKVYGSYIQTWQSLDYSSLVGTDAVQEALGTYWTLFDGHGRWPNWNKDKDGTYNFYQHGSGSASNITIDNNIYMREVVFLAEGMGLGRNVAAEGISINNTAAGDIVKFEIYNGYGNDINKGTNTYISYAISDGVNRPSMSSSYGALLVQAAIYRPATTTATIGDNGYATFASPYNVKLPTGVTAYTAKVSGNYVNFTEVESGEIPANKGVLLKGTAGEITLDVIATATALGANDFKVNTSGATFAAAENTTYFAMVKDSDPLKFGTVNPSTVAIPANKAYLAVVGNSEARLTVTFDGETTAIKSIDNAETSNAIYNLNGQRVEKAQKGLYIVNGKKTIVK